MIVSLMILTDSTRVGLFPLFGFMLCSSGVGRGFCLVARVVTRMQQRICCSAYCDEEGAIHQRLDIVHDSWLHDQQVSRRQLNDAIPQRES